MLNHQINIVFSIKDLIIFALVILGVVLGTYLIVVLKEMYKTLKNINTLYLNNVDDINLSIKSVSTILDKAAVLTESVSDETVSMISTLGGYIDIIKKVISMFSKKC